MCVSHQNSLLLNDLRTKRFRCCRWPYKTAFAKAKRSERLESEKVSDVIICWKFFFSRKLFLIGMKAKGGGVLLLLCDFFLHIVYFAKDCCFWNVSSVFFDILCQFLWWVFVPCLPVGVDLGEKDSGPRRDHMLCGATTAENQKDTREDFASVSNYCEWKTLGSGRKGGL